MTYLQIPALFVPTSVLESIRRAEFRLGVPIAERLDFTPTRSRDRVWMSRLVPVDGDVGWVGRSVMRRAGAP